jgi:hypothetical protein
MMSSSDLLGEYSVKPEDLFQSSTIDKSQIVRSIIALLPEQFHRNPDLTSVEANLSTVLQHDSPAAKQSPEESGSALHAGDENDERVRAGLHLWDLSALKEQATFLYQHYIVPVVLSYLVHPPYDNNRLAVSEGYIFLLTSGSRKFASAS